MRATILGGPLALLAAVVLLAEPAAAKKCKADAMQVGGVCVDKYEASVWEIAPSNAALVKKVQNSKVTSAADLSSATQHGRFSDDYGAGCPDTGNGCKDFYAVSIAAVTPASNISWFQAAAACRNAGKRLATNQEWQMAALGTPESECNLGSAGTVTNTGEFSGCVSDTGNFDMVGNLGEWVADWVDHADFAGASCTNWGPAYGNDASCFGSAGNDHLPGALVRGGYWGMSSLAGVFAIEADFTPFPIAGVVVGFRCAREM